MATGSGNAYVTATSANTTPVTLDAAAAVTFNVPSTSAAPLYIEGRCSQDNLHDADEGIIVPAGSSITIYAVSLRNPITSFLPKGVGGTATYSWGRASI